jgi:hypothetical protein
MPSARSSASAPVGIAAILIVAVGAEAHQRALAELALDLVTAARGPRPSPLPPWPRRPSSSLSCLPSLSPHCRPLGQLDLRQRGVLRTLWLEFRTVERHRTAKRLAERSRQASGGSRDERRRCEPRSSRRTWLRSRAARTAASPARRRARDQPLLSPPAARPRPATRPAARTAAADRAAAAAPESPSSIAGAAPPLASTISPGAVSPSPPGSRGRRG